MQDVLQNEFLLLNKRKMNIHCKNITNLYVEKSNFTYINMQKQTEKRYKKEIFPHYPHSFPHFKGEVLYNKVM